MKMKTFLIGFFCCIIALSNDVWGYTINLSFLDQFSMTELEQRLETDPLAVGQLLTISSASTDVELQSEGCCLFSSNEGEVS